ncbi:hypothetical protein NC651_019763 [Populus alba x Populus x berolinensis]|nr:hypothetical protein NC651_019763 [Populus alba x Populus x berolinensis]
MRKFDPWPVFFKREWNRNWPFLVGFAITGALITKFSLSLTEEDAKNSPFVQRHKNLLQCMNLKQILPSKACYEEGLRGWGNASLCYLSI